MNFTLINTNARSLKPKLDSLLENIKEVRADVIIVTESWLKAGEVEQIRSDLNLGYGLGMLARNRPPKENGVAYGGVVLLWKENNRH